MTIERIPLSEIFENVTLTGYLQLHPDAKAAMIICAGGGYLSLNEEEAEYVAIQFLAKGYQTFILNYSVGAPYAYFPAPFVELGRAVRTVRERADRYQINPQRIYVCGLSTGGHMASILGSLWYDETLGLSRPNAIVLGYSVLDLDAFRTDLTFRNPKYAPFLEMMFSAIVGTPAPDSETLKKWNGLSAVSEKTVPCFIWNTVDDEWVNPNQAEAFSDRLNAYNVPFKHLVLDPCDVKPFKDKRWIDQAAQWLNTCMG